MNKHNADICSKYNETVLPDEDGNCSLCGAQLVGTAIVYSKLVSTDPDQYEEMGQAEALKGYTEYLNACANSTMFNRVNINDLTEAKTFSQWLESEI